MSRLSFLILVVLFLAASSLEAGELKTSKSVEVKACVFEVWSLLVNADDWSLWNPAVKSSKLLEGDGESEGSRVKFVPIIGNRKAPAPIKLMVKESGKPFKLEYTAAFAGINIVFGFTIEEEDGVSKVTSYETVSGSASGLFEKVYTQEGLDEEHRIWVDSIKRKVEMKGCGCNEKR